MAALVAGAVLAGADSAAACSLDNRPSMSAGGILARLTKTGPTASTLSTWAIFTIPRVFSADRPLRFGESQADVRLSLPASALAHPWRWSFGDGATQTGFSAAHSYRRAGTYRVSVRGYFSSGTYQQWLEFDAATISIR